MHELFSALGGTREVARKCDVPSNNVRMWRKRKSIPAKYWSAIVSLSAERGCNVTLESLAHYARTRAMGKNEA
jgi:hypothetical protein